MTPDRLTEIEARCNGASSGPILVNKWGYAGFECYHQAGGATLYEWSDLTYSFGNGQARKQARIIASNLRENDAEFIAHARTDIPALIAEIRRLQAIQDKAEAVYCLVEYHSEDSVLVPREAVRALGDALGDALEAEAVR